MTAKERMTKVSEVAVRWLSGQLTDDQADDAVFGIMVAHVPDDDDIDLHVMGIWDGVEFEQVTFMTPEDI